MEMKCKRPYMERYWRKEFKKEIDIYQWEEIYVNRIYCLPDNKLKEFMYKLFHNIIPCREILVKWKKETCDLCPICKEVENIKHIYYSCQCIQSVWSEIGNKMKMDINWDKILLGFTQDIAILGVRNLCFSFIMYAKYKFAAKSVDQRVTN